MNAFDLDTLIQPLSPELKSSDIIALASYASSLGKLHAVPRSHLHLGNRTSKLKGHGIELHEVRPYSPSDEVRHMDWRITARTGIPHSRVYTEDSEHRVFIILSLSADAFFGTETTFISTRLIQLAALIAWRSRIKRESVGLMLKAGNTEFYAPKISDWQTVSDWLAKCSLLENQNQAHTAFEQIPYQGKKGYSTIILSDHLHLSSDATASLMRLSQHNRVYWVNAEDQNTFSLPDGVYEFARGNKQALSISSSHRDHARQQFNKLNDSHTEALQHLGIQKMTFDVNDSPLSIAKELLIRGVIR